MEFLLKKRKHTVVMITVRLSHRAFALNRLAVCTAFGAKKTTSVSANRSAHAFTIENALKVSTVNVIASQCCKNGIFAKNDVLLNTAICRTSNNARTICIPSEIVSARNIIHPTIIQRNVSTTPSTLGNIIPRSFANARQL